MSYGSYTVAWIMNELKISDPKAALDQMLLASMKYSNIHRSYFGTYKYHVKTFLGLTTAPDCSYFNYS